MFPESLSEEPSASKGKAKPWLSPHSKEPPQSTLKSFFASLNTTPLRRSSLSPKSKEDKEPSLSDLFSQVGGTGDKFLVMGGNGRIMHTRGLGPMYCAILLNVWLDHSYLERFIRNCVLSGFSILSLSIES